jgi:creatinine amidohydrolase/Fe(II)-dependent formamide hydrolase-like protein
LVKLDRVKDVGPRHDRAVSANYHIDWINQVPLGYIGEPWLATPESAAQFMDAVVDDFMSVAREIASYRSGVDV